MGELKSLVKDEYANEKVELTQIDIKEYVTAELNDLEIHAHQLMKQWLQQDHGLFLSKTYLSSLSKDRCELTNLVLNAYLRFPDLQSRILLTDIIRRTVVNSDESQLNVFKDVSLKLAKNLDVGLRGLL